jgi:hypothetical protein
MMKASQSKKLIPVAAALALIITTMTVPTASAQSKPNVIIMLGDNVGYGDIGC